MRWSPPTVADLPDQASIDRYMTYVTERRRDDALARAQELADRAAQGDKARDRRGLALKALGISPLCADAYTVLAEEAANDAERRAIYERGVAAGGLAFAPAPIAEYGPHIWTFVETRGYLRARYGLAATLMRLDETEAAMAHLRALLELNPRDQPGARYLLLQCLAQRDDTAALRDLLAAYPDDSSATWLFTGALVAFRDRRIDAAAAEDFRARARAANIHVPDILSGRFPDVPWPKRRITPGAADEAADYVRRFGMLWRSTPGAVEWIVADPLSTAPPKVPREARRTRQR